MPTLDWIGKQAVVNHHREVPYRLLRCDEQLSAGDPEAGNLLVRGGQPGGAEGPAALLRGHNQAHTTPF